VKEEARAIGAGLFCMREGAMSVCVEAGECRHAASVFSTSLTQYDVPKTIASSLKL
jgi:hypothetical protein